MSVLDNWQQWTSFLGDRVIHAKEDGMKREAMTDIAVKLGGYLSNNVEPKNEQERVMKDLWSVAKEDEQHVLANLMIRLVQQRKTH
ncbi:DUF3243 domain-containing protein [Jeotgalibacillus soli]|uniref:DUF3243 domain-containing protein n=1 Tax=Jeotgalibacillus soli TaxID=889306 RepID=A0A0C2VKH3_9BACL|nr:DUF3243 domain-containing protein [Jeotgalibacillus soli]KIL44951.1 hypothetical protein KP78_24950 [Jeotgalibacillus soli]